MILAIFKIHQLHGIDGIIMLPPCLPRRRFLLAQGWVFCLFPLKIQRVIIERL
jgi:hypothetical protein